jgi:phosphoesterase RecJ-like protein
MIAMALLLKSLRIKATMFSSDAIPGTYNFLPHVKKIRRSLPRGAKFDVAIAVDAGDTKRLGRNISLRKIADKVINIDHHSDNTHFGDVNLVGNVSSSAELIYDICGYLKIHITKDMAICLYTAIITDTGSFRYENTSVSTFNIAAQLVLHGAAPNEISNKIYETKSVPSLKVLALALNGLRTLENEKIVWACVTRDMIKKVHAENEELTGIIDHLRSVKSAEVAILFREESDGLIKINLRSKKKINVQKIANELGGGGHARAAGVSIRGSLSRVSDKVLKTVQKHLKRSK